MVQVGENIRAEKGRKLFAKATITSGKPINNPIETGANFYGRASLRQLFLSQTSFEREVTYNPNYRHNRLISGLLEPGNHLIQSNQASKKQ